jgi:nicotinamidase-related amidase
MSASPHRIKEAAMAEPRTLLQMNNVPSEPNRFSESAVVIIDAQNDYRTGLPLTGIDAAAGRIAALLVRARAAGAPVFHVVQKGAPGRLFDLDGPGGAILPEATPVAEEAIVVKTLPSSFAATDLLDRLRATGRTRLIVAGFMTHMCVSTTVRAALDHGFRTTVVGDAAATRALPDPLGGPAFSADTVHRMALAELADRFAVVVPLDAIPD